MINKNELNEIERKYINMNNLNEFLISHRIIEDDIYNKWCKQLNEVWLWDESIKENRLRISSTIGSSLVIHYLRNGRYDDNTIDFYTKLLLNVYDNEIRILFKEMDNLEEYLEGDEYTMSTLIGILHYGIFNILKLISKNYTPNDILNELHRLCYDIYLTVMGENNFYELDNYYREYDWNTNTTVVSDIPLSEDTQLYGFALSYIIKIFYNLLFCTINYKDGFTEKEMVSIFSNLNSLFNLNEDYIDLKED